MKIWTSEHTFNHPWETVAQAAWRKYPNPINPAVTGTDVVERKVEDGILHTSRLISSKWYFPRWVQAIIGTPNVCYATETSTVNPVERNMTLKTVNITFGRILTVDENLYYKSHPTDPSKTLLQQDATVSVAGVPLGHLMEDLLSKTISSNAGKGRLALEWVIEKINSEVQGIATCTDEIIVHTKKSIDDITETARKSMDELSTQKSKIRC